MEPNSRNNWSFGKCDKSILYDKEYLTESYIRYMLNRTQRMFVYKNLPETIPQRDLELLLQTARFVIFTKDENKDEFYVFFGGLGGVPNVYYQPTIAIVSNPYLKFFKTLELKDYVKKNGNAVVIWNDSLHMGLLPMFDKYASLIAECDISMRVNTVLTRLPAYFKSSDDNTKDSISKMLEDLEQGKLAVIGTDEDLLQGEKSISERFNDNQGHSIKDLIELRQYLIGSWYNDLGLNANYNMKREAINESEADLNEDALLPLIDDMLESRRFALKQINEMFGLNIEVELSTSWKKIRKEVLENPNVKNEKQTVEKEQEKEEIVTEETTNEKET